MWFSNGDDWVGNYVCFSSWFDNFRINFRKFNLELDFLDFFVIFYYCVIIWNEIYVKCFGCYEVEN